MELASVVPWGRSFSEYKAIFSLSQADLAKKILGCSDGPASFNAELTKMAGKIISVDPLYQFNDDEIKARIEEVYGEVIEQVDRHRDDFIWDFVTDVDALGKARMASMELFLHDYQVGKAAGRYINASLPNMPFNDDEFELAVCSHYLFLYSEKISLEQHILAMKELSRVAKEVRVYPLITVEDNDLSPHLEQVISALEAEGKQVYFQNSSYQFQKGATEVLVVKNLL